MRNYYLSFSRKFAPFPDYALKIIHYNSYYFYVLYIDTSIHFNNILQIVHFIKITCERGRQL